MVPFKYIDFWDVPRFLLLKYRDHLFLLASYFDEEKDDYDDNYSIEHLAVLGGAEDRGVVVEGLGRGY